MVLSGLISTLSVRYMGLSGLTQTICPCFLMPAPLSVFSMLSRGTDWIVLSLPLNYQRAIHFFSSLMSCASSLLPSLCPWKQHWWVREHSTHLTTTQNFQAVSLPVAFKDKVTYSATILLSRKGRMEPRFSIFQHPCLHRLLYSLTKSLICTTQEVVDEWLALGPSCHSLKRQVAPLKAVLVGILSSLWR